MNNTPDIIYLADTPESHENLLPLSFTRPIAEFRIGITTIREKWEELMPGKYSYLPVEYLREKYASENLPDDIPALFITGALIPGPALVEAILSLRNGDALFSKGTLLAYRGDKKSYDECIYNNKEWKKMEYDREPRLITYTFDIFRLNPSIVEEDFFRITAGRRSAPISTTNKVIGKFLNDKGQQMLFVEEGASVEGATINLTKGPVYIGKNAEIMEGSCVRGPLALCEKAKIRMGSKIYGGSTFGPYCKVGGEIDNTVMFGYSNKAHDGYLGNAVIGEWCNIGAGVNASNLKNDYTKIRVWNYRSRSFMRTDLQFCGPIIGDHTKIGVNCMLNTATVLGVGVNIHGSGFPRVFVPSFSEGSAAGGFTSVPMKKFHDIAERVMSRRDLKLSEIDNRIYEKIYEIASSFKK